MSAAYADPWRPNYERRAFILWVLVAGVALVTAGLWGLPTGAFHWLAWLALAMALTWVRGAVRIASHHAWLRGHPLGCIAPEDFAARLPSWSGDLWLGWGFDWLPVHTQLALDLMRAGPEQFAPRDPQRMGATWLHGLGGRDQDLRIPLSHTDGHMLIVGVTGAGKTRTFDLLVTQAVLRGEAVLIIDPKGDRDLRDTAQRACVLAGSPARFVQFHPAFPAQSVRIDTLHSFNRATELASRVAALIPSETGNDPFKSFGQMVLSNVVQGCSRSMSDRVWSVCATIWKAAPKPWSSGRCGGTLPRAGPTGRPTRRPCWPAVATSPRGSRHWCATTASGSAAIIPRPSWRGCSGSTNTSKSISPRWSPA